MNIKDPSGRLARWAIYLQSYEFDIIHRPGRIHSNVDALSRPILPVNSIVTINNVEENGDVSEKQLDIFEDEALLHFIKFGRHIEGIGSKTVKRVNKLALLYKYDGTNVLYLKGEKWLKVPPIQDRHELILKAHLMGHFQSLTTYNRLKEDYFWRKMREQVDLVIKQCAECARNQKEKPYSHPAIAMTTENVLDCVGIDLVLGLSNDHGHIGILFCTDKLSKYVVAYKIKAKEQNHIASKLKKFILTYGPPKCILSDKGGEFCNELINNMLRLTGTEHKITSAYNPRTN